MPYSGMTSKEVCAIFGMSRQMFKQSGLADAVHKVYPFGHKFPLYDTVEVAEWEMALQRRRGLIELGRLSGSSPILQAPIDDDRYDTECPRCHGWALGDPLDPDQYLKAIQAGQWPTRVWCPSCGIVGPTG